MKRYPDDIEVVQQLSDNDPSGDDKYLNWMAKQAIKNNHSPKEVIDTTQRFHKVRQRLQGAEKDIYQWSFPELQQKLQSMGKSKTKKREDIKSGAIKIYEDDKYLFIAPLSTKASCYYGASTKWCISGKESNQFSNYALYRGINFIFMINKKPDNETRDNFKIALVYYPKEKLEGLAQKLEKDVDELAKNPQEIFNAKDAQMCQMDVPRRIAQMHDIPINRQKLQPCEKMLDRLTNGLWSQKYQPIMYTAQGEIRESIQDTVSQYEQHAKVLMETAESFVNDGDEITLDNGEIIEPYQFKNLYLDSGGYATYSDGNLSIDKTDTGFTQEYRFSGPATFIKVDINLMSDLGLKQVEYSFEEKLKLVEATLGVDMDNCVKKFYDSLKTISDPAEREKTLEVLSKYYNDSANTLIKGRSYKVVFVSMVQAAELMIDKEFASALRSVRSGLDYKIGSTRSSLWFDPVKNPTSAVFGFDLSPLDYGSEYLLTLDTAINCDKNLKKFFGLTRKIALDANSKLVNNRNANLDDRLFDIATPDKKYNFWEPV